jgi:hypothetical protein
VRLPLHDVQGIQHRRVNDYRLIQQTMASHSVATMVLLSPQMHQRTGQVTMIELLVLVAMVISVPTLR